jgi:pimeloyl-ACP methyl ester carboxylesterase
MFDNPTLQGTPSYSSTIDNTTSLSLPGSSASMSARWSGSISVPEKTKYQFIVESQDGVRIWIDGNQVLSKWSAQIRWEAFSLDLAAGQHTVKVEYYQQGAQGRVSLRWKPVLNIGRSLVQTPTPPVTPPPANPPPVTPPPSNPPPSNPPTNNQSAVVVFITGGNMSAAQVRSLQNQITTYYKARLPANTPWLIYGYNSRIVTSIQNQYPGRKVILIGHSFGGDAAIRTAASLQNPVELLMLFDPVHIDSPSRAENFVIPTKVKKAIAYRRQYVDGVPASGLIAFPRAQDNNVVYPMDASRRNDAQYVAEAHGWAVWQESIFPIINSAL